MKSLVENLQNMMQTLIELLDDHGLYMETALSQALWGVRVLERERETFGG